jgi:hypothetical protein
MSMQRGISQVQKSIAKFTAHANLSVQQRGCGTLDEFIQNIASMAIRLTCSSPDFRAGAVPGISPTTFTRRFQQQDQEAFDQMVGDLSGQIHYMDLLTDSDTVLGFTAIQTLLRNPNDPGTILPLDIFESRNYDGCHYDHYEAFSRSLISEAVRYKIEPVAIICDNCPAQVNGIAQALAFFQISRSCIFHA